MRVIAKPGILVPKEHSPRDYITFAEAVEVPDTPYYRRRIADGDLAIAPVHPVKSATKSKKHPAV
jgi:hypothetical protein